MRLALPRLFVSPSVGRILPNGCERVSYGICSNHFCYPSSRASIQSSASGNADTKPQSSSENDGRENSSDDTRLSVGTARRGRVLRLSWETSLSRPQVTDGKNEETARNNEIESDTTAAPDLSLNVHVHRKSWRTQLASFEQYQYESDLGSSQVDRPLLVNQNLHAGNWSLWLELINFRRRHYGVQGPHALFQEIFRRGMSLPTRGSVASQLWDTLIMVGYQDLEFFPAIISYAVQVKQTTGEAWPGLYYTILLHAFKTNSTLAYSMHVKLRESFPPSVGDYQRLFKRCVQWKNISNFEELYRDLPLPGMYATVIPELCTRQRYRDAVKWHNLLFTSRDFPPAFVDMHPLFAHLAQKNDGRQLEQIVNDMKEDHGEAESLRISAEEFVRRHNAIGREIINRQLGEIHGVAPKHLSDSFCARLFATMLFSVDTIINGLSMMAVNTIGPLTMREIALRDDCDGIMITRHLARLKDAGATPDNSIYSTLIHTLASRSDHALLRSLTACDLHPEAFEDQDLQERLLAQYCERDDPLQFERTLAAITVHCREAALLKWQLNLTLRCYITLRKTEAVISIMQTMRQKNIPMTARSSRHLRVCWLSKRQRSKRAWTTQELTIIINATRETLQSGRYVPIIAWREIMRRLGMAGRLDEFENLALWLVDFYTDPTIQKPLPPQFTLERDQRSELRLKDHPPDSFRTLFTIAAQHAIIAWGFQQEVKGTRRFTRIQAYSAGLIGQRPLWTWGLLLLQKLQARGVPIHQSTVARICRHRLNTLFGPGISNRHINRRSRRLVHEHYRALDRWAFRSYIREMKNIWGDDLFRSHVEASLNKRLMIPLVQYVA